MPTDAPQRAPGAPPLEESVTVLFPSWQYRPLRPGPGRSPEQVAADQRSRLQRAVIELVAENGYPSLTVRALAKRAQISSGVFYRHYRSTDDCFLSTYDQTCRHAAERMMEAGQRGRNPRERVTLAIERILIDIVMAPQVATFMLRSAPASGPVFTETLRISALQVGGALEYCLRTGDGATLPQPLMEGVVAGLARIGRVETAGLGRERVPAVASDAAVWMMSVCGVSPRETSILVAQGPPGQHVGRRVSGGRRDDPMRAMQGDDRGMLLSAAIRVARTGHHHLTVPSICREAGVPRRSFGRYFAGLEECFSTALETRALNLISVWRRSRTAQAVWSGSVQRALELIGSTIEGDADGGRLLLVEIFAAGTQGVESRDRLISQIAQTVRATAPAEQRPSNLEAEASTTAAWTILAVRLTGRTPPQGQIVSSSKR
jgi:AcrR family transcriptional regulator